MRAANAIGDDTLMQQAGRAPVESMFTHGTSEQRMEALKRGIQSKNRIRAIIFRVCNNLLMRLTDCHNVADFRAFAKSRLPSPIFNYIDGAATMSEQRTAIHRLLMSAIWCPMFSQACRKST